jgi:hypothetical protein
MPASRTIRDALGIGSLGLLVEVMIRVAERTRSGQVAATSWVIIPPMETPTRWLLARPRASITPQTSAAISRSV